MNSLVEIRTPAGIGSRQYRLPSPETGDSDHETREARLSLMQTERPRMLMCAPNHFAVSYSINPWMQDHLNNACATRAGQQWDDLRQILGRHASIETITAVPGLPDMPFTANAGLLRGNRFVPSRFRHAERKGEEAYFTEWFRQRGAEISNLPASIRFEGAGDALFDETLELLWMGYGQRSELAAAAGLARLLDADTIPLRLIDARFYHLDTCFCPLPRGFLLWYPQAFEADSRALVESRISAGRRIAVDEADALAFACNAISLGSAIVLHRASGKLKRHLDDAGFTVIETPLDEFQKAGGSAKCLSLCLNQ
jgi:N-dimethylarginine dimethylaminohydrolase